MTSIEADGSEDGLEDGLVVKICGITSEADALLAVGFGADALGFVLAPSPRQVTATLAGDIIKRLPHDVLTVGVFWDESPQRVVEIAQQAGFGAVQLHGHETAADCRWVRQRVPCTIKAFAAGESGPVCIVTEGRGTIQVSHKGKTYYVCCSGCKDLFTKDPEAILAEAAERAKEKEKAKK